MQHVRISRKTAWAIGPTAILVARFRADADFRVDDPVAVLLEFFSARILLCYLGLTLSGRHSKVEPLSGVVFLPLTSSEVGTRQLKDRSSDEANPLPWKKDRRAK